VIAAATGWWASRRGAGNPPAIHEASSPADRLSALDAYALGLQLGRAGRNLAAMPYFVSAVARAPRSWAAHENYACTLCNGAQEARTHLGKVEPATRSSVERMTMIEQSFGQTDTASTLAGAPADRALVLLERAQSLHTFGFPIDGLVALRHAAALDASLGIARTLRDAETELRSGGRE
jgi:choline dehydrogenase-like flavoprotein